MINAAECEPLLHKDKELLHAYGDEVLEGLQAAMRLVGAAEGWVGIKEKYQDVIDDLRPRLPGGVQIAPLRDSYPAGDEFILVYDVLGRVIPPGGIPLHVGAVVINVETALNVARSSSRPVVEKFLTIAGAVAKPVTLRVPIGVTLAQCVAAAGGATVRDPCYVVGGVMMGRLEDDHAALVDKTTGGVVGAARGSRRGAAEAAGLAPDRPDRPQRLRPVQLLHRALPAMAAGPPDRAAQGDAQSLGFNMVGEANVIGTSFCCECNLCSLYSCPEDLDPKSVCVQNKRRLASEQRRWEDPPFNPRRPELHLENRKAPMARLIQKLGLAGFRNVGPARPRPARHREGRRSRSSSTSASRAIPPWQPGQRVSRGPGGRAAPRSATASPPWRRPSTPRSTAPSAGSRRCGLDREDDGVAGPSSHTRTLIRPLEFGILPSGIWNLQSGIPMGSPMPTPRSIGALEFSCIGFGIEAEDEMLKAASVELLVARTICSGKYLVVLGGSVSDVQAAIRAGLAEGRRGGDRSHDHRERPRLALPRARPVGGPQARGRRGAGGDRDLQRDERAGGGRRRRQGRQRHRLPDPRGHGPGRQGAPVHDRRRGRRPRRDPGGRQARARPRDARLQVVIPPAQAGAL